MSVDLLIIGSGVAAAALAQEILRKDPKASVLMLEAGPRVKTKDFGLWENFLVTGNLPYDPYKDMQYPQNDIKGENMSVGGTDVPLAGARVMTYGGSTIHWGGWSFRMKPEDFELHTRTGVGLDWPFDYDHLEPYYCRAEAYIGVSGDSRDPTVPRTADFPFPAFPYTLQDKPLAESLATLGIAYSHLPIARHGVTNTTSKQAPCQTTGTCKYCPFGARYAATNFLDDMVQWNDYPNFEVRTETVVHEILMDSRRRAAGVRIRGRNATAQANEVIYAQRIVVAAGAIESAKLLQRSVSPFWTAGIGNDDDQVGRYLVTHPYFNFKGKKAANRERLMKEMDFPTLVSRYFDSTSEQAAGKFILVNPPDTIDPGLTAKMKRGMTRQELDQELDGPQVVSLQGMVEVFGRAKNRVTNALERNRLGMLQTIVDYTKDEGFDSRMHEIQEHVSAIFTRMKVTVPEKPSISWRADHAASTCRMGTDPSSSVVDPDLRIHGVDNLYVCSNATFPNLGAVNPTLTLTALAIRLGEHLAASETER
ncbi:GMC family oxidoreductase [Cupriavidus taiwanensis]|uniref:GMC family oxidoreductase n=1 Tax=Cupriavidus taiwanensis TaxID=164546 RepID=UPI0025404503|nr:GMC family oxidoreductase [Cupriavidus taiwanensis]MDK3025462.1 GMC family oxidoreductase [Cupriavidus taiwanensis]